MTYAHHISDCMRTHTQTIRHDTRRTLDLSRQPAEKEQQQPILFNNSRRCAPRVPTRPRVRHKQIV